MQYPFFKFVSALCTLFIYFYRVIRKFQIQYVNCKKNFIILKAISNLFLINNLPVQIASFVNRLEEMFLPHWENISCWTKINICTLNMICTRADRQWSIGSPFSYSKTFRSLLPGTSSVDCRKQSSLSSQGDRIAYAATAIYWRCSPQLGMKRLEEVEGDAADCGLSSWTQTIFSWKPVVKAYMLLSIHVDICSYITTKWIGVCTKIILK